MTNPDQPHGYNPDPDGRCYVCQRDKDAVVHTAQVIDLTRHQRTPRKPPNWNEMATSQRFVVATFGIGCALVFLTICVAISAVILRFAGLI